jgi:hypothetical protein
MARLTPKFDKAKIVAPAAVPAAAAPVSPVAPAPTQREQSRATEEKIKTTKAAQDAETAAKKAKGLNLSIANQEAAASGEEFNLELARLNAEEDLKTVAPPIYVGGFNLGTTTPLGGVPFMPAVGPARPINIAVPKAEAPGFFEAMRPQTIAPPLAEAMSARRTAEVFDDSAFSQSIADLPAAEKKSARATHEAFKKAFFKLRADNPVETGVTDEELLKELRQQITDFENRTGPTLTQGTANRGDIGGALERRVTPATLQIARPGALVYFSQLSDSLQRDGADAAENTAVANLMKAGVPVMEPVPGNREGLERQTGTRPVTPADVAKTKEAARKAYVEANPIPLEMLANRDELLANSEASATGGTLFQKEYITGATVESSLGYALRAAFTIPNFIAGEAIDIVTPESTRIREQAARPAGQKDVSPGAYNIATGGGFMKPITDLWTYSPVPLVREYAAFGQAMGLAADLLSLEAGAIGGLLSGGRAMFGTSKALGVVSNAKGLSGAGTAAKTILAEGAKTAAATTVKSIGLPSVAKAIYSGDIRLLTATHVAENYKALAAYDNMTAAGGDHLEALEAAKQVAPRSFAVKEMAKQGDSFSPSAFVKDSAAEYKEFKDIDDVVNAVAGGAVGADVLKLRPYLKAASADPNVSAAIVAAADANNLAEFAPTLKASEVVDIIKNAPGGLQKVRDAVAFDKGFKAVDKAVGALEPGKEIVAITPRTFGTAAVADQVVEAAKETTAEKLFSLIEKKKPEEIAFTLGGRQVNDVGYDLKVAETKEFISVLSKEANTGTMPKNAINKAIQELRDNKISASSLRELRYSNVDGVAEEIRVAATKAPPGQGTFPISALAPDSAKSIRYGDQTNSITLQIEKASKAISDNFVTSAEKINKLQLNPQQAEIVSLGKSRMSEVDKVLKSEFESLKDPAKAAAYGLGDAPNNSQKIAALALGQQKAGVYTTLAMRTTLNNYIKSTIFGNQNLAGSRFFVERLKGGGFEYVGIDDILNPAGRIEVEKIVDNYAAAIKSPDDALRLLPQMSDEVFELTKEMRVVADDTILGNRMILKGTPTNEPKYLSKAFSGKTTSEIYRLNKPEEALIGAYARNKGEQIFSDTLDQVLSYDALATSRVGQLIGGLGEANPTSVAGRFNYNGILRATIAHQLGGAAPLGTTKEMLALPAVNAIIKKSGLSSAQVDGMISLNGHDMIADINGTAAVVARKFGGGPPGIEYATELRSIANGDIALSELGTGTNPFSFRNAVREELGSAAKYDELETELAKLAEEAAKGSLSAVYANRKVTELFDLMNSFFYNAILNYAPRFHGRNFFYAPLIAHMTTGIGLNPQNFLTGARIMEAGAPLVKFDKNVVVVTDRIGNKYTAGELYKIAVESGALKSQASASIDAKFLDEAAKLGLGDRFYKGFPKRLVNIGGQLANGEDNLWRLATITRALRDGETLEGAVRLGRRSLFDFGAATPFERQYVARKILFYNYMRNSVIQSTRVLLENPARVLKQYRLTRNVSAINIDDEQVSSKLSFYAPYDAGVANVVLKYGPKAGREGQMTVLPNMPYVDGLILALGLAYEPLNTVLGQEDLVTGERDFGTSYVYERVAPLTKMAMRVGASQPIMEEVMTKKNQLSPTHVAAAAQLEDVTGGAVPALKTLSTLFNVTVRDALPGEENSSYGGKIYELSPADFEEYKTFMAAPLKMTGMEREVTEWPKIISKLFYGPELGLAGKNDATYSSITGLTSQYGITSPLELQTKAIETSTAMIEAQQKQKEIDAGLRRPDEPKKAGRIK